VELFPSQTSGVVAVGIVGLLIAAGLFWLASSGDSVTAGNVLEPDDLRPIPTGHAFGATA
jgi:hypothetical protein